MKSSGEKKIAMFFEQIKKDIFPEWDKKDEWRVKNLKHDSNHINSDYLGKCDSTGKIIYLNLDPEDWKIEMLMVHEICHAQKGCKSHGDQWKEKNARSCLQMRICRELSSCGPDTSRN